MLPGSLLEPGGFFRVWYGRDSARVARQGFAAGGTAGSLAYGRATAVLDHPICERLHLKRRHVADA